MENAPNAARYVARKELALSEAKYLAAALREQEDYNDIIINVS